jgi:hypothetical protein
VFFIHHGDVVIYCNCPDVIAFQENFPQAESQYISSIPSEIIGKGYEILDSQRKLLWSATGGMTHSLCLLGRLLIAT